MTKGKRLDEISLRNAILGGTILGGGGGGSPEKGLKYAKIAVEYGDLRLVDIQEIDEDAVLLTAALVGAPKAPDQFIRPSYFGKTIELFQTNCKAKLGGIITNENGGEATVNGWLQAALTGLPLVDAPCNGRAHPTGVMGSMGLHKDKAYMTCQAVCGGNPDNGTYVECVFQGSIDRTAKLVRMASIEAGGLVLVARNPVPVSYAKQHCAVGGISHAIALGEAFYEGLNHSPHEAVTSAANFLGGEIMAKGRVDHFRISTEGGFDVGNVTIGDWEMTFWNEYMTLDRNGARISTFPNLIMTFDANTGMPLTTAMMEQGMEVYVISADKSRLKLSSTMGDLELLAQVEPIIQKEIVKYQ